MIPLNWKMKISPGHFRLLVSVNQHAQKELIILIIKGEEYWHYRVEVKGSNCNGGHTLGTFLCFQVL